MNFACHNVVSYSYTVFFYNGYQGTRGYGRRRYRRGDGCTFRLFIVLSFFGEFFVFYRCDLARMISFLHFKNCCFGLLSALHLAVCPVVGRVDVDTGPMVVGRGYEGLPIRNDSCPPVLWGLVATLSMDMPCATFPFSSTKLLSTLCLMG